MRCLALVIALALTVSISAFNDAAAQGGEPYEISTILPLTGYGAFLGRAQSQTLSIAERYVNSTGGIRGRPVHFAVLDSQSNPQIDIQLTNELLAKHPSIVIEGGPATVCQAVAPLYEKGPLLWCLSPAFHPKPGGFAFSSGVTRAGMQAVVNYVRTAGLKRIGFITVTDIAGQEADEEMKQFLSDPVNRDLRIVAWEHFGATDLSVGAQIAKIKQAEPQVVIAWATGAPIANVLRAFDDAGLVVPFITTPANQTWAQMQQYKDILPREYLVYSLPWPQYSALRAGPLKRAIGAYLEAMNAADSHPDNATAIGWDPAIVIVTALRTLGANATPEQLRTFISNLHDYYGPGGRFDFRRYPESGIGLSDIIIVRWSKETSAWSSVSTGGGEAVRTNATKG